MRRAEDRPFVPREGQETSRGPRTEERQALLVTCPGEGDMSPPEGQLCRDFHFRGNERGVERREKGRPPPSPQDGAGLPQERGATALLCPVLP